MTRYRSFLVSLIALAAPVVAAHAQDDRAVAVGVVRGMFDAMARGDTAGMRSYYHPEARIIQTGNRDGAPWHRLNTLDGFLGSIGGAVAAGRKLEEKVLDPTVQLDDNFVQIWSRYEFYVDGTMSHCGVDGYHLIRTTDGWKIIQIIDTQRRPCGG